MLNANEFILGIYDTKNNVLIANTLSLENVEAYSVNFYVVDVTTAGLSTDPYTIYVKAVAPAVAAAQANMSSITPEVALTNLLQGTETSSIWSASPAVDSTSEFSMSDSGFGYKQLTISIEMGAPSTDQFLIVAVLSTTKANN